MKARRLESFIVFALIGFWPVGLWFMFVAPFFLFQLTDRFIVVQALLFLGLPTAAVVFSHSLFLARPGWKQRGWVIYGAWLVIGFLASYVVSAAIGGTSMAVVEGVASATRFLQYARSAVILLVVGHVVIVPWVFFVLFLFKTIDRRLRLWSDVAAS